MTEAHRAAKKHAERINCYCAKTRSCDYHQGYEDGWDDGWDTGWYAKTDSLETGSEEEEAMDD